MALTGILNIEREQQRAVARKTQLGALYRRAAGMLEQAADAEAAKLAALLRFTAALLETVVIGQRQRLIQDRLEITGVVSGADRGLVRHRRFFDQVAPAQFRRIDAGDAGGLVDHALEDVARLRPPG